jgi:hypothetical protein
MYDIEPLKQRNVSLSTYRKEKLRMLQKDFCIKLTPQEIDYANSLTTEIQLDQFCLSVINQRWG